MFQSYVEKFDKIQTSRLSLYCGIQNLNFNINDLRDYLLRSAKTCSRFRTSICSTVQRGDGGRDAHRFQCPTCVPISPDVITGPHSQQLLNCAFRSDQGGIYLSTTLQLGQSPREKFNQISKISTANNLNDLKTNRYLFYVCSRVLTFN